MSTLHILGCFKCKSIKSLSYFASFDNQAHSIKTWFRPTSGISSWSGFFHDQLATKELQFLSRKPGYTADCVPFFGSGYRMNINVRLLVFPNWHKYHKYMYFFGPKKNVTFILFSKPHFSLLQEPGSPWNFLHFPLDLSLFSRFSQYNVAKPKTWIMDHLQFRVQK